MHTRINTPCACTRLSAHDSRVRPRRLPRRVQVIAGSSPPTHESPSPLTKLGMFLLAVAVCRGAARVRFGETCNQAWLDFDETILSFFALS